MYKTPFLFLSALSAIGLLAACSGSSDTIQKPLPGERISILDLQKELAPQNVSQDVMDNINIPPAISNTDWPQAGGYPHHAMQNVHVGNGEAQGLEQIWRANIGKGTSHRIPLNATPIVADGKVFTLDANSRVRAFHDQTGKTLWEQSIKSLKEKENVISGGLAYSGGIIFATSGYNEVLALNPADGEIYWRTTIPAGSRAAPTVLNGRVFVTALNNSMIALDATSGKALWEHEGVAEATGLLGAASPAADGEIVIPAFSSGDITALRTQNGSIVWEDSLANSLRLGGMSGLSDIRGLPVITRDRVIAASFGGKIAAFNKTNGSRLWQKPISSAETPWVSGNAVYVLTADFKIIALDLTNGETIWISNIQKYENEKKRDTLIHWTGPIMVNGKLLIAGSKGRVRELNPLNGQEINSWKVGRDISIPPIVANGTLFILTDDGSLSAYR